ncbi:UxaA family hydrolase [Halarsenatibacter silvermanii]|uniref:D-altronate dehydratase n=1 Tax=Halarsenatibacter silvermanii TaxID=321763 RepID=A0A1G9TCM9_9FIRM|nr:altronate dehydratase family protein [Halarsenatibacter silvermanii]SDM45332.1 D-altronate dehydratase [Halarsenatibacter silvermanii]
MGKNIIKISENDNVAVALENLKQKEKIFIGEKEINIKEEIPQGHKVSLADISPGEKIIKYGHSIGVASKDITKGKWVHTHNMETSLKGKIDYEYNPASIEEKVCPEDSGFYGYERENGEIGIRNEIWILNTVGCINKVSENIARKAKEKFDEKMQEAGVDDIVFFSHPYGCSQLGGDLKNTQNILSSLVQHPNAAGVLICGLGCENNTLSDFKKFLGEYNKKRIKFLTFQEEKDEINASLSELESLIEYAGNFSRKEVPLKKLNIGLKCGGSDSFSGITANPLLGRVSDRLISCDGASILSEVPEMFGAEQILMQRAKNKEVFNKIVEMINGFKEYFLDHNQEIYENPSPGNIEGGITTLEEKSLGNIEKGGKSKIVDGKNYGERIDDISGLHLLESPGNDLVSTTALAAAGAHIVLFTTGRGTPFGGPVPTVKISTNNSLYNKKENWLDFNAGEILQEKNLDGLEKELFDYLLEIGSGQKRTINEKNDYREIAIFKSGVTL